MTESIRTDFASEVASLESEEEYTSAYSDKLCVLAEGAVAARLQEPPMPRYVLYIGRYINVYVTAIATRL